MTVRYLTDGQHLICEPYSIANLHDMAEALKIKRHWFHKNHYDIPLRRKDEIIAQCDDVVSSRVIVLIIRGR